METNLSEEEIKLDFKSSKIWLSAIETAEYFYQKLIKAGISSEISKFIFPTGVKYKIIIVTNDKNETSKM